jgi:hypothetical protein
MSAPEINRIVSARILHGHTMELEFGDGYVGRLDLTPALWGPVFAPLLEPENFSQFRLEDETLRWSNDADFCPDVLRFWCESGGIQNQERTDAHFAELSSRRAAS